MSKPLEIIVARHAGFCMGVRRALNFCLNASDDSVSPRPIHTLGPLIHNRQVLDTLELKGVGKMDEDQPITDTGTVVIRAHGVSPERLETVRSVSKKVIDATCPHVSKVQEIVKRFSARGYTCIIVGDPGHAEVEGVMSYAGGSGIVVSNFEDAKKLKRMKKAVVVAQTTQSEAAFAGISSLIEKKCEECEVFDTICRATQSRQNEAIEISREVEAMVVVGGYDSANTRRLAGVCAETGASVFHVETERELPVDDILRFRRVGITAGASTPNWMIQRVVRRLQMADEKLNRPFALMLRRMAAIPVRTNAMLGGGAACMAYAAFVLMGLPRELLVLCMALAFCFITSQHLLHQYARRKAMLLNEPERGMFFENYAGYLALLAIVSATVAIVVSFMLGPVPFLLVLLGTGAGMLYCIPAGSGPKIFLLDRIRRLAGSKELFVAAAWAATTVLIPFVSSGGESGVGAAIILALFAGLMAFHRTLITDMRDLEGDQLAGRETVAVAWGRRKASYVLLSVSLIQTLLLLAPAAFGWISYAGYGMMLVPAYSFMVAVAYLKDKLPAGELGEALADAAFYIAALIALAGSILLAK